MTDIPDHPPNEIYQMISPDQALGFLEALTGSDRGADKSPQAKAVLMAVLGVTNIPMAGDVLAWAKGKPVPGYPNKIARFIQYLRAVATALERTLPRDSQRGG